jgi:putative NADH-flavin reductase
VRVAIFGATGRTGMLVVEAALTRGLDVTGGARDPEALRAGVRAVEVDARDPISVAIALEDADAVISAMGLPTDSPPTTALSEATATVASAMKAAGIEPFVFIVNGSVFLDAPRAGEFEVVDTEHRRDVEVARTSGVPWIALAAPWLKDDGPSGRYRAVVDGPGPGRSITRRDLASALVDALDRDEWHGHLIGVTSG